MDGVSGVNAEHVVQFYDDDSVLITEMGRALQAALDQGNAAAFVVTNAHRRLLEDHLTNCGIDVAAASVDEQIVFLDAAETLTKITVDGLTDVVRFAEVIGALVDRLAARFPRLWIFGELVALMRANGNPFGAVKLERLWTSFAKSRPVVLYCACPASAFASKRDLTDFLCVCEEYCRVLHSESSLALAVRETNGMRRTDFVN